jgi:carbon-monoxide dehydrogenase medium subunit
MSVSNYFTPGSIKEAVGLLSQYGEKAKVISGGTDLHMQMKHRELSPEILISISGIPELNYIRYEESGGLRVGVSTSLAEIAGSPLVRSRFRLFADAAGMLGNPTIRNQATLGGNLCNAAPSADTAPPLLVMGARVKTIGKDGEKVIPVADFFKGPGMTALARGHLLTEIQIPNLPSGSGGAYLKEKRREGADLAVVGVAALVVLKGGLISDIRIALGAVAPTPIRAGIAEEILKGNKLNDALLDKAGQAALETAAPIDDVRSSAEYRKKLVAVLTRRAVTEAVHRAEE